MSVCCSNGSKRLKDTAANIKATKSFTVNIISEPFIEAANVTAVDAPEGVSEWPISGLTKEKSVRISMLQRGYTALFLDTHPIPRAQIHVKPARVKESAFSMECEVCPDLTTSPPFRPIRGSRMRRPQLFQVVDIADPASGAHTTTMLLGHVRYIHVRNDMLNERGNVDPARLRPVGRMGDITYARVGDGFRLARPVWANEQETIKKAVEGKGDD